MTNEETKAEQARVILALSAKLGALNIRGTLANIEAGPIVTTYYFNLAADIPIAKVMKAEEDLALAVGVAAVLISRTGGKIAIAIPNKHKELVSYDSCLHTLMHSDFRLPIMLGVNTNGEPALIDLIDSPHILIAGSTGAGKSVLLSAIISGLATFNTPQQMKLLLVDTKQLDLTLFNSLPHVADVADTVEKTHALFDRLMLIVRQRTEKMKGVARNVTEYNSLQPASHKLPYYVVIIDELADVINEDANITKAGIEPIASYPRISRRLQNLVQISRAAGCHVICATQRPSVKIITGDIKANFATRIALRLPTGHDSKTIINEYGAEQLLGKGDMLIESPIMDQLTRFHGPYVSMDHIANVLINCEQIRDSYRSLEKV
jgi:S-DNA-T family DNA segregation ATPase FtsK/SpoIIIE